MVKCQLLLVVTALGCGGATSEQQTQQQASTPGNAQAGSPATAAGQSNASSVLVPMSMVLPKKAVTPPAMTAPAFPQAAGAAAPPTTPGVSMPMVSTPTAAGAAGAGAAAGMMAAAAGGGAPSGSAAGAETSGVPEAELAMLRDTCVAEINMYRATLPDKMLKPLVRATPAQEECSQRGAKMDGDSMSGHGAFRAGLCNSQGFSAENSCPGYPVGGFGGGSTIADTFKSCMKQMWAEGEPPGTRQACIQDSTGCFEMHGHYLNMTDPNFSAVSCPIYVNALPL